jgi:hypothetical protein
MRFSELDSLRGSNICAVRVAQDRSYGELSLLDDGRTIMSARFSNHDRSPIEFKVGDLNLCLICGEDPGDVSFGEFEYYTEAADGWLHVEGDAGQFSFRCDQVVINSNQKDG